MSQLRTSSIWWRALGLTVLLLLGLAATQRVAVPDPETVRRAVNEAGAMGPALFIGLYAAWTLLPVPKNIATIAAGAVFGLVPGAALAWSGAMTGAVLAYGVSRALGRDAVDRLMRGRLSTATTAIANQGFLALVLVRLVPVVPFTVINYGAGVTAISLRSYVAGSAVGMIPGTVAYAALGASTGTNPTRIGAAVAALVLLTVAGWVFRERLLRGIRSDDDLRER